MFVPTLRATCALSRADMPVETRAGAHARSCSTRERLPAARAWARGATTLALTGALLASLVASPAVHAKTPQPKPVLDASAVAVPDRYAADAAQQIFAAGGNAVDAAVAVAFTLAVTYPDAGNIGGGGFMTVYMDGKPYFLDYREKAPQSATRDMYLDDKGNVIKGMSLVGHRAVAVPGTVDGMWEAQKRFGKL
ncbi:MAG TPA: gamma-glutamyltransferase, partial [Paraburkholderia sp.]|nr:gamma-glutamyltransferase [Paraburkholderia sp.]